MINDNEGMDNALEYYINGGDEEYWQWFIKKMEEVTNVDSAEEIEEEEGQSYWDEYDYDDDDDLDL